ncbi:pseudouridine synthase PUS6 Ecym_8220 [Eremothecium cymbalariae DBVPG|uniref:Pseudouridine synthase n=1 Tax=Eremothecium cymbalariae (strain CBS 270.75 / DBVPG 7215 / KCTC 17166 / NRRL Y-17582) TaxID=931890 RepID=G8JXD1_ERECY|nr:Hypothetical protein Ecym_8220 [Eremothecium cymbalariae DBVPG\
MEYHVQNGLRKIKPYWHTRSSFVKGRWFNKTLAQVLVEEFHFTNDEVQSRIKKGLYGLIRDNTSLDCNSELIRNKDVFTSKQHNHEPPVLQWRLNADDSVTKNVMGIPIVYEDDSILVINKPCGIPIHPIAYYYKNTLTEMLKDNLNYPVFPCHRLDKITSGILIFAKNQDTASVLQAQIRERTMKKLYLARVEGEFSKNGACSKYPIYTFEPKKTLAGAFSQVKDSETEFLRIDYNESLNQSLVLCKPFSGRTHQIRIHLARLGHPIVNDPFYNVSNSKYPKRTKFMLTVNDWSKIPVKELEVLFEEFLEEIDSVWKGLNPNKETCNECGEELPVDPPTHQLSLYLHALSYNWHGGSFKTDYPEWSEIFDTKTLNQEI